MYIEHDRRSLRLPGYDYASLGAYYLTICAFERAHIFGTIRDGMMELNWLGEIVRDEWLRTGAFRSDIRLDEFVIMPNHVHAVVWIVDHRDPGIVCARQSERFGKPVAGSIPTIMRAFKAAVSRAANQIKPAFGCIWQRGYYDRIIRDDREMLAIREYICNNPTRWSEREK